MSTNRSTGKGSPASGSRPVRVLVVDDHAVIRQGLRMLLESHPGIEVVADCENGREALLAVERLRPDVVLMDVVMPGLNGIEATRQVKRASASTKVVILSGFVDEEQITGAIRAGASGYLVKNSDVSELILAIQTVHRGNQYYSAALSEAFDIADLQLQARRPERKSSLDTLTPREREVLQLIAEGRTNQQIADELVVSVKTVEAHKAHIMEKLKARSRTDLIRYALKRGIVKLESVDEAERSLSNLGGAGDS
ncbi:response regulator [Tepidiforma thermophila]|uniref:LuxR family two component transcriptional regulator n=1 Tax=Tepidiforma thermophila (strain KCTC 52669 / CGMCC 1.13589 / G233) TaxID=2761530 RepID=A0A2A9HE72_TEPT2|nr:response regulator transcription factor [Tepidiforma thermophila]PFG74317.1 LuxR family two component transcriptional regulator [Tepidiforma thermophila]